MRAASCAVTCAAARDAAASPPTRPRCAMACARCRRSTCRRRCGRACRRGSRRPRSPMPSGRRGAARSRAGRRRCAGSSPTIGALRARGRRRRVAARVARARRPATMTPRRRSRPPCRRRSLAPDSAHARIDPLSIAPSDDDVTADLAREAGAHVRRVRRDRRRAVQAARRRARRAGPIADRRQHFDARLAELRAAVATADEGHARQRALRAEIRYLQGALIRDEVASNDRMLAAPGRTP